MVGIGLDLVDEAAIFGLASFNVVGERHQSLHLVLVDFGVAQEIGNSAREFTHPEMMQLVGSGFVNGAVALFSPASRLPKSCFRAQWSTFSRFCPWMVVIQHASDSKRNGYAHLFN